MRLYTFNNMYISSIQVGLQSAHVVHELFVNYHKEKSEQQKMLLDWASNHKTMILLEGGYSSNLQKLTDFFNSEENPYPWSNFHEEKDSLNGALTSVGIVLPQKIYLTANALRNDQTGDTLDMLETNGALAIGPDNELGFHVTQQNTFCFSKWEIELCQHLIKFSLAR